MALTDYKITDGDISTHGVVAAPDKLTGTAAQNKAVFDQLIRDSVKADYNALIDALTAATGAGNLGALALDGTTATNVQAVIVAIKALLDACETHAAATSSLALKEDKTVTAGHYKAVTFDSDTGTFTFTKESGATTVIDTALEKVVTNFVYDADSQSLVLTLADGTTQNVSLSAFITETEFVDSNQIDFSVSDHTVTATIKAGSITDTMLASALVETLTGYVTAASGSATNAAASEGNALIYKNAAETAKAAAETAQSAAETAQGAAETAQEEAETAAEAAQTAKTDAETAKSAAETAENNAAQSARDAAASASTATTKAGEASTSAAGAATSESNAAASASTATTKAGEASASAGNAASSASAAATDRATASTAASTAATAASNASTAALQAATAASNASTSEDNAAQSARDAAASAQQAASGQVNSDWNATGGKAEILNKPTNVSDFENDAGYLTQHQDISGKEDKVDGKGLSTNDYTTAEKDKLSGIEAGAQVNVAPTWDSVSGKPETFPPASHTHDDRYYTETEVNEALGVKQDKITVAGLLKGAGNGSVGAAVAGTDYQDPTTAITVSNIGSQSVSYASTATYQDATAASTPASLRLRSSALSATETTPSTNGAIVWQYE